MRKPVVIVISILFLSVMLLLFSGILQKSKQKALKEDRISSLPSFSFIDLENRKFYSDSIAEGPVLIVRFHPECEHCQYEISEIFKSKIPDSRATILLISSAQRDSITAFLASYKKAECNKIITLIDESYLFGEIFGRDILPSNYIYDKELKLIKVLYGEHKIETIIKYLGIDG